MACQVLFLFFVVNRSLSEEQQPTLFFSSFLKRFLSIVVFFPLKYMFIAAILKHLKHPDSNMTGSRDVESNRCLPRATASSGGRVAPIRNCCYRPSALLWLWNQAPGAELHFDFSLAGGVKRAQDAHKSPAEFWHVGAGCLQVTSSC